MHVNGLEFWRVISQERSMHSARDVTHLCAVVITLQRDTAIEGKLSVNLVSSLA